MAALVLLAVPVIAAAEAPPAAVLDVRPRADDTGLREALERLRQEYAVPGIAAAVFDTESIRALGVGETAPGDAPVTPETRFRAGQVSLLFAGLATAALIADGRLPADGELRRLAPEVDVRNPWSAERPVRIDDLVSQRAGFGALHFRDVYAGSEVQPLLAGINSAFRALRLERPPGERERYSVVGHAIAAYLVEKAADAPYEDVLDRLVFQPLDATATLGRPGGPRDDDAQGHTGSPPHPVPVRTLNLPPAGEVWISAADLAAVGRLLLNRGRSGERELLPASAIEWIESLPEGASPLVPGARRGVRAEEFNGFLFYTRTGALPGFLARFAYSPELGRGYLVLMNRGDAEAALRAADTLLRGQLFAGHPLPGAVPPPAENRLDAAGLAGWYRNVTPGHPPVRLYRSWLGFMKAGACGDALCIAGPGLRQVLQPFDGTRLRERGHWQPGWRWHETGAKSTLETAAARWQPVGGWQVLFTVVAGFLVAAGLLLGVALAPVWGWSLVRRRISDYHELVPRLVPLAAVLSIVAMQLLLFVSGYPALGRVSAAAISILVLSVLAPLLAVLALAAVFAGFRWRLPRPALATALYLALAANGAVIALAANGLVAFQSWNY